MQAQGDHREMTDEAGAPPSRFPLAAVLVAGAAMLLGGAFWAVNGPAVFIEMASAAWALCF